MGEEYKEEDAASKKAGKKKTGSNVTFVKKAVGTSHDDKKDTNSSAATDEVQTKSDKKKDVRTKKTGTVSSTAESHSTDEEHVTDEESSDEVGDAKAESGNTGEEAATAIEEVDVKDDDDEWMAFQNETKKDNLLETKSKETHLVHSPYFPLEKYEWWWLYLAESKRKQLTAGPLQVCTLRDVEEKELRFAAPLKPGNYQYIVVLRSDSYMGVDQSQQIKIDVKEAKKVAETHPQWEMSDDEDNKKTDHGSESDSGSEDDSSVDDDDDD